MADDASRGEGIEAALRRFEAPLVRYAARPGVAADEGRSRVLELVDGLPDAEKQVLLLRFQDGLSYRDIGEVTGRTVSHVGVLLHQAVKRMREALAAGATALEKAAGRAR